MKFKVIFKVSSSAVGVNGETVLSVAAGMGAFKQKVLASIDVAYHQNHSGCIQTSRYYRSGDNA